MKSRRVYLPCFAGIVLIWVASILTGQTTADEIDPSAARIAIHKAYEEWGKARVSLDRKKMEAILAPDFYADLYGRKITREEFISTVSRKREGFELTRFDVDVLTVTKTDKGWTVVITEKLEVRILGPDGKQHKQCSLWVTRDGLIQKDGAWRVTSSEAIGHQSFKPDFEPPIDHW